MAPFSPYRAPLSFSQTPPRAAKIAGALLAVGLVALMPMGCSAIETFSRRSDAHADAPLRQAEALAKDRPDEDAPFRVTVTPLAKKAISMADDHGSRASLVPVAEAKHFALVVEDGAKVPPPSSTLIVHRDRRYLAGDHYWGMPGEDISIFVIADPREEAAADASVAGVLTIVFALVALLGVSIGMGLGLTKGLPRATPKGEPWTQFQGRAT